MPRVDHQSEFVPVNNDGVDLRVVRLEGKHTNLDGVIENLICDAAGKGTLYGNFYVRILTPVLVKHWKQKERGIFVRRKVKAATMELTQFCKCSGGLGAQVEELECVFTKHLTSVGEGAVPRRTLEKNLTQFAFELRNGLTDRGLSSVQAGGGS